MMDFTVSLVLPSQYDSGLACPTFSEDQRADLALRIGRVLEGVRSLDSQTADVLLKARRAGFVRSYKLVINEKIIAEWPWSDSSTAFTISIGLIEKTYTGDNRPGPLAQRSDDLCGYWARQLGESLQELLLLGKSQIVDVLDRACSVGFLRWFKVSDQQDISDISSPGLSIRTPPFLSSEVRYSELTPEDGIPSHPTTESAPRVSAPPESDGTLSTLTPRAGSAEAPGMDRWRIQERRRQRRHRLGHGETGLTGVGSDDAAYRLKSSKFNKGRVSLNDEQIEKVLEALDVQLLTYNFYPTLRHLLDLWCSNLSQGLHIIGLPNQWRGIEAAVHCLRALDSGEISDPIGKRIAHMLLFLNFKEICRRPAKYCPRTRAPLGKTTSFVLNCIVGAYAHDQNGTKKSRHDKISAGPLRLGRWWWKLASTVGVGILLVGNDELMTFMRNSKFTNAQIDALISYVCYAHPGTIRLLHSLESISRLLIFGQISNELVTLIHRGESGLPSLLSRAVAEDEEALVGQQIESTWTVIDSESAASKKVAEFLDSNFDIGIRESIST